MAQLPRRLTLPSGRVVELSARGPAEARRRAAGEPLFAEVLALFEVGTVTASLAGAPLEPSALPLADFHVLRAVLTKAGFVHEEPVTVTCANCGEELSVSPCAALEIGPWVDGELGDPELDTTLPFGEDHEIAPIPLGRARSAKTITFAPRTVGEARPLLEAAAQSELRLDAAVASAMGVVALGPEEAPARIADALAATSDEAWGEVCELFLASHYPARLVCVVFCPSCRARNDVDAPYERELEPSAVREKEERAFPTLERFADRAHAIGEPLVAAVPGEQVVLVVDDGTPAVDDGGVPLLGAYDPPHPGDAGTPTRPPTMTVWYRSFREEHDADSGFDWDAELRETIEHELVHHVYFLRGEDPMDDEERAVIRDEARRIVGKREAERRAIAGFGGSVSEFARRTWPLWLLALLALALGYLTQR